MSAPALRDLMTQHNLTRADVARLLGLEVRRHSHGTVDAWLSGRRNMPAAKLELLRMKLELNPPARAALSASVPVPAG